MAIGMKIGIISDLHGNLPAVEAVLHELQAGGVADLVCLGDVAAFGPQPREVLERLRALRRQPGVRTQFVMGNTDAWLLDPRPHDVRDADTQKVTDVELWAARQLTGADRAFIRAFRPTVELDLGEGQSLICFHGSPRSHSDIIVDTTPESELESMLGPAASTMMAGGHTHAQMLRRYGEVMLINPGSVGLPYQRSRATGAVSHPAWAEYAVVEVDVGSLSVTFRRVPFDRQRLIKRALACGMPHADWWVAELDSKGS